LFENKSRPPGKMAKGDKKASSMKGETLETLRGECGCHVKEFVFSKIGGDLSDLGKPKARSLGKGPFLESWKARIRKPRKRKVVLNLDNWGGRQKAIFDGPCWKRQRSSAEKAS